MYIIKFEKKLYFKIISMSSEYEKTFWKIINKLPICWQNKNNAEFNLLTSHNHYNIHEHFWEFNADNIDKLKWCRETCTDDYGFKYNNVWYFKCRDDMLLFTLRWQ